jgi:uncharacterized protein with HEPN domain
MDCRNFEPCFTLVYDDFVRGELRQSAVLQKLVVMGEAAARLSTDSRARHPAIEWQTL